MKRFCTLILGMLLAAGPISAGEKIQWPNDADGDVFRQLSKLGLNFAKEYVVDFNVDFPLWPPSEVALKKLKDKYGQLEFVPPEGGDIGHVRFQLKHRLTYDWVMAIQRETTRLVKDQGGVCDSWGVGGP